MYKYSGVVLDYYDDGGDTLKAKFPDPSKLPEFLKNASVTEKHRLPMEAFALVALDGGAVIHKYACHDAASAAISTIYFMEHGHKLPQEARTAVATKLASACLSSELQPPAAMLKLAAETTKSEVLDLTGKTPEPTKTASPSEYGNYAVELPDGQFLYPIHTHDLVKKAEQYYMGEAPHMEPGMRRMFAMNLSRKAQELGCSLNDVIKEAGATTLAEPGHRKLALEMRKVACPGKKRIHKDLDALFVKSAELHPNLYAEVLRRFDIAHGLDARWGNDVLDPWSSTFSLDKTAEVVWDEGAERVTDSDLKVLATNHIETMAQSFSQEFVNGFQKDPVGVFKSLPTPQKKVLARLATEVSPASGDNC